MRSVKRFVIRAAYRTLQRGIPETSHVRLAVGASECRLARRTVEAMRVITIVVAIGLGGCVTKNVSTLGPFVRNIQAAPEGLVVDTCEVQHVTTRNYAWMWIGESHSRTTEIQQGQCYRQAVPMGGL
jgi:hypothetical protein